MQNTNLTTITKMKYFHHPSGLLPRLLLLLLFTMGAVACTKEDNPDQPTSDDVATVKMSLDDVEIRNGDLYSGEDLIKKVRIFVFREGLNGLWALDNQKLFISGQSDFQNPFAISAHAGPRHIYVIANEPDALTTKLNKILFKKELDDIQAPDVNGPIVQPFTMTGMVIATLNPQNTVEANVSLNRIAAKITLDIKQVTPGSNVIKITNVQILRNAKNSRLLEGSTSKPTGYWNWMNVYDVPLTNNGSAQSIIPAAAPLYVYENIGSAADSTGRATQLVVDALYNGIKTRYYAYVNDQTTTADHHYAIHRNHHYKLDGTITKIGEFSSLLLTTTVLPWTVENLDHGFLVPYFALIQPENILELPQNNVTISNPLTIQIKIKGTDGSQWHATLDNGLEFGFDTVNGVNTGEADGYTGYTVIVKPLKAPTNHDRQAKLYFTVNGKKVVLKKGNGVQLTDITIVQQGH
ncbi:major fimbrial subunit protein (FimA) [Porphyromonas sp. COT-052 OH4946]|uniref:fimbrial protein n=1 Tax=Porphyromonas sp. COT-052 OH4946 TaxID=1515618 RepID=UPI00051D3E1B|nr:fimbrial protein [Porphyromonas sp. COT-052 OH4946]KGL56810.1 major fimbrial subunit protein (FimA) [Porphyromonas sp. COT-052 OH4946]